MYKIPAKNLFVGKRLISLPSCHSTNEIALEMWNEGEIAEGLVIVTDEQTHGKGQAGNTWESEKGKNLTLSVVLKPGFLAVNEQFELNIVVSLAIHDMLHAFLPGDIHIKWPNDIIWSNKKIAGILIQNLIVGSRIEGTIAGIGLNVNQTSFKVDGATSLQLATGKEIGLERVMEYLLQCIENRYLQLRAGKTSEMRSEYLEGLYWRGEEHEFEAGTRFRGTIFGIDGSGRLGILVGKEEKFFSFKEVVYIE